MKSKLRPSDIYTQPREEILNYIKICGWKVVDFREPVENEVFYSPTGYLVKYYYDEVSQDGPRLICIPIPASVGVVRV